MYEEPEGEIITLVDSGQNTITVLTRVDSDKVAAAPPFNPSEHSVAEIRSMLDEMDLAGAERRALIDAEKAGKDRKTAMRAITE